MEKGTFNLLRVTYVWWNVRDIRGVSMNSEGGGNRLNVQNRAGLSKDSKVQTNENGHSNNLKVMTFRTNVREK